MHATGDVTVETHERLRYAFKTALDCGRSTFVVNLSQATSIDSLMIGELVACLKRAREADGDQWAEIFDPSELPLAGKTFVITGTLQAMTREEIKAAIIARGGKVTSTVSRKTDFLIAGEKAGSKLDKAQRLDVVVLLEPESLETVSSSTTSISSACTSSGTS